MLCSGQYYYGFTFSEQIPLGMARRPQVNVERDMRKAGLELKLATSNWEKTVYNRQWEGEMALRAAVCLLNLKMASLAFIYLAPKGLCSSYKESHGERASTAPGRDFSSFPCLYENIGGESLDGGHRQYVDCLLPVTDLVSAFTTIDGAHILSWMFV